MDSTSDRVADDVEQGHDSPRCRHDRHDVEQFLRLKQYQEALTKGDREADARLLSDDFLGVYAVRLLPDRAGHVAELAEQPDGSRR